MSIIPVSQENRKHAQAIFSLEARSPKDQEANHKAMRLFAKTFLGYGCNRREPIRTANGVRTICKLFSSIPDENIDILNPFSLFRACIDANAHGAIERLNREFRSHLKFPLASTISSELKVQTGFSSEKKDE